VLGIGTVVSLAGAITGLVLTMKKDEARITAIAPGSYESSKARGARGSGASLKLTTSGFAGTF
jgi:hypothetical protein